MLKKYLEIIGLNERRCLVCSKIFNFETQSLICQECEQELEYSLRYNQNFITIYHDVIWNRLFVIGLHDKVLRRLLLRAKYHNDLKACKFLGQLLAKSIKNNFEENFDYIIPMPLHTKRLRHRGYNQCIEIAALAAKELNIPISLDIERTEHTVAQTSLKAKERVENIKDIFVAKKSYAGKNVLLFDDTVTTGTSLHRLATSIIDAKSINAIAISSTMLT